MGAMCLDTKDVSDGYSISRGIQGKGDPNHEQLPGIF